jgi:23S rRNA (cytidine2498-2'-O)-methyltransferase
MGRKFAELGVKNRAGSAFSVAKRGMDSTGFAFMLFRGQPGFEALLVGELGSRGLTVTAQGGGWALATAPAAEARPAHPLVRALCFAYAVHPSPVELAADSVNALAGQVLEYFLTSAREERFDEPWPCVFTAAAGLDGLGRRADAVATAFGELLRKRLGRVARLATSDLPRGAGNFRGLFVHFIDFKKVLVSRICHSGGQRRMADDPLAPSRSYLKIEEAYTVLEREPAAGELVVDLGAAPGGWSYSAAKRGARVLALDNGPLKGGALDHPLIEHQRADAYGYRPGPVERPDWLFCDLVDDPHHVVRNLITPWLENGWCRRFIIILKFGRVDALALLHEVQAPSSVFSRRAPGTRVRHLYHDREEFTLVGELSA